MDPVFAFGRFRLNPAERLLLEEGNPLRLGSRALDLLTVLVEHAGETVLKDDLIARVWPNTVVDEGALRVHIAAVRKVLGEGRNGERFITSIPGRGYSFVAPVTRADWQATAAPPPNPSVQIGNLSGSLTRVIGRTDIITAAAARLGQNRLLTIVGPGGIGKTTVAIAAAEGLAGSYADGVWFVSLAPLQDPALVPSAIIAALGSEPGVGDVLSSLAAGLRDKRALIVLDSCEHVIAAVAATVEAMLRVAPQLAILTTSREPLRAEGEWLVRLPSLEVPPEGGDFTAAEALRFPAVELFSERAAATLDSFVLTDDNVPITLEICRRLDGVPLAIELAAAQIDALGLSGLVSRLDNRLAVLTRGRRTALPRQQTLRATIDWSYDLLSEPEQHLLRSLAVFPASFTLEAVAAVAGESVDSPAAVSEGLASLVSKSLVNRDDWGSSARWRLLETIRTYALEKLAESGDANAAARRHAAFFRDLIVPTTINPVLRISRDDAARYAQEIDNVRAALDWSFSADGDAATGVFLTAAFAPIWLHLSLVGECRERAEQAVAMLTPDFNLPVPLERRLHIALGVALTLTMGPVDRTRAVLARARQLAESVDDVEAELRMLWAQWSMENILGEYGAAQLTARRFAEVARRANDPSFDLVAESFLGTTLLFAGKLSEARDCLERVVAHYVPPSNGRHRILFVYDQRVLAQARLARVLFLQGFADQAEERARISLTAAQAADAGHTRCWVLHHAVCPIALLAGDIDAADRALAMMHDLAIRLDAAVWKTLASCWEGKLLIERREFAQGAGLLQDALDTCDLTGWHICNAEFLGILAEGLAGLGQLENAIDTVEKARAVAEHGGELYSIPELLRIKARLLLQQGASKAASGAEDCLLEAIAMAEEQGALFWQLRSALSLARLRTSGDRPADAKRILAPVFDRFSEGFETADLRAARDLLHQLSASFGRRGKA